jgi:hypothetical protein
MIYPAEVVSAEAKIIAKKLKSNSKSEKAIWGARIKCAVKN